ncbi:LytTR family DNA-binding domain-containing protein [Streptococcus ruminantium]|nr:LytTR family DNA-binding domain-containing protein [Streptococcus ruminantium]MDQ8766649.1 LytTR family DNA-binding domain-containing protein [Streptococcus ruminantium]MDQ8781089.1 LytTR family DNA-binding domain-containing protein [Streptococcus ruminantium]
MKIKIELDDGLDDLEVVIRASHLSVEVEQIQQALAQVNRPKMIFYKGGSEYFLDLTDVLFFETDGTKIFAHSRDNAYEVKLKLYELEECLPFYFCRISKSSIANIRSIYSLEKSFSGTSTIHFYDTVKQIHVSRHYYQLLKEKLREMR